MCSDFKTNSNVVYSCKYHGVWCPKYRRMVLVNSVDMHLKEILHQTAQEFRATVGGAPLVVIKQYIENQKGV